jgi:hypothetical protein
MTATLKFKIQPFDMCTFKKVGTTMFYEMHQNLKRDLKLKLVRKTKLHIPHIILPVY